MQAWTICIFYDRVELSHAKAIAAALESTGFKAWLADRDSAENWRDEVLATLKGGDCFGAVTIWSPAAVGNPIVIGESEETIRAGRALLGVILDGVRPPLGLENGPRVLLEKWDGSADDLMLDPIKKKLLRMIETAGKSKNRIGEIVLEGRNLQCPAFVFSVSSFETQISPAKTLELLNLFPPPALLLSAYDVLGTRDASPDVTPSPDLLQELESKDTIIFLDSGNYEAYRLDDLFWQRSPWLLREAISRLRCDVVFCHDRITAIDGGHNRKPSEIAQEISFNLERDTRNTNRRTISPIVHAPRLSDGSYGSKLLPEICTLVARKHRPPLIAVAERELGDGILQRAKRVRSIRKALDRLPFKQPLHILGTGNPLSIMILALAGGDVFDGLEWCRTVVDPDTMRLHHFHQFDLFIAQRSKIQDDLLREYLTTQDEILSGKAKAVLHNLYFFKQFAKELRQAQQQGSFEEMFGRYLPGEYTRVLRRIETEDPA